MVPAGSTTTTVAGCATEMLCSARSLPLLTRLGHLWVRAAGKKNGLLAAQSRPSVFAQLVRQTHDYLAPVRLICACIWCTACGGDLDRRSGAQLSLVMVFSERDA